MHLYGDKKFAFTFTLELVILLVLFICVLIFMALLIWNPRNGHEAYIKRSSSHFYAPEPVATFNGPTNYSPRSQRSPRSARNPFEAKPQHNDGPVTFADSPMGHDDTGYNENADSIPLAPIKLQVEPSARLS